MKYKVVITEQANIDLREIFEYIAFTLLETEIAAGQLDRIEEAMYNLSEMPYRFKKIEDEPWNSRELHQMPVDNYIVFYIPKNENKTVTIIRVLYERRDISYHLKKSLDNN